MLLQNVKFFYFHQVCLLLLPSLGLLVTSSFTMSTSYFILHQVYFSQNLLLLASSEECTYTTCHIFNFANPFMKNSTTSAHNFFFSSRFHNLKHLRNKVIAKNSKLTCLKHVLGARKNTNFLISYTQNYSKKIYEILSHSP